MKSLKKKEYYNLFINSSFNKVTNEIFTELEFIKTQKKYSKEQLQLLQVKINSLNLNNIEFLRYRKRLNKETDIHSFFNLLKNNLNLHQIIDKNNNLTLLGNELLKITELLLYFFKKEITFKEFSELGSSYSFVKNLNITNPYDLLLKKFNEPNFQQLLVFIYNLVKNKELQKRFFFYLDSVLKDPKKALGQSIKYLFAKKNKKIEEDNIKENLKTKDYFILIPKKDSNLQDLMIEFLPGFKNILTKKGKDILIYSKKQKTLYLGEIKLINQIGGSQNHQWNDLKDTSKFTLNLHNLSIKRLKHIYFILYNEKTNLENKEDIIKLLGFDKIKGIGILHGSTIEDINNKYMSELLISKNIYLLSEVLNFDKEIFNDNEIIYENNKIIIKNEKLIKQLRNTENFLKQISIIKENIEKNNNINIKDIINRYNKIFNKNITIANLKKEFELKEEFFESFLSYNEFNFLKQNINNISNNFQEIIKF